jgi:hypothetical protein
MKFVGIILLSLLAFYFYLSISLLVYGNGYQHPEGVFLTEKGLLALKGNPPRLENIGLIYPPLPFYVLFPFIFLTPTASPFLAASLVMSVLVLFIGYRLVKHKARFSLFLLFVAHLILNPTIIYAGSSGGSLHLYLTFLVIFYVFIFEHYIKPISFYLALAGTFLGLLVLIRYEVIFILPGLFFATIFLSIETAIGKETSYKEFFKLLIQLPAYRKTFIRKTISMYLMLFIPPVFSFVSWIYLNWLFTSNPLFFLDSPHAYFRTLKTYVVFNTRLLELRGDILKSFLEVIKDVLIASPNLFFVLFLFRRRLFHLMALFSPVLGLVISAYFGLSLLNIDFFAPFIMLSFVGLLWAIYSGEVKNLKFSIFIYTVLFAWSSLLSIKAFQNSNYPEEKFFIKALLKGKVEPIFKDEMKVANFLKETLKPEEIVLVDDANGYPIVVFHGEPKIFILPYQYEFYSAVQTPEIYADYILVYNPETFEGARDAINATHKGLFHQGGKELELIYDSKKWRIFRSNSKFKIKQTVEIKR